MRMIQTDVQLTSPNPHLKMANMMSVALTNPIKTNEATLLMEAATVLAVSSMDGMGLGVGVVGGGEMHLPPTISRPIWHTHL